MAERLILEKLEAMERKVDKIENAVGQIAVQTERINNISGQVNALWEKYDQAFGPGGIVYQVKAFQAACPGNNIKESQQRVWFAVGTIGTMMAGGLLKAFGVL